MIYEESKIDEVRRAVDLVGLIRQYVDLKRVGDSYRGLCPFHVEKSPSFYVTPEKGVFHCFGCGAGGTAFHFLMMMNNMTFPEALEDLARRYGVSLPSPKGRANQSAEVGKPELYRAMRRAADFFQDALWAASGRPAMDYLKGRGLSVELVRSYRLGLSLDRWDELLKFLKKEGFGEKALTEAGLIRARRGDPAAGHYDVFRNRLMTAIFDPEGREVAFAGRVLPGETDPEAAKYINSPSTPIYKKGRLLYGFHQARSHMRAAGMAFLVEGYFDLLALAQVKVQNVVAAMGTSLTQEQINLLRGQVGEVYLLFDGDEAGLKAASRALPALLNVELEGKVVILPKGEDPDSFVRRHGADGLFRAAERAMDLLDYYAERLMADCGPGLGGQARAIREAKETLRRVPDSLLGQLLRRKLGEKLGVDPELLNLGPAMAARPTPTNRPAGRPSSADPKAKEILAQVIVHPELARGLLELEPYWPCDDSLMVYRELCRQFAERGFVEPAKIPLESSEEMASLVSWASLAPRLRRAEEAAVAFKEMVDGLKARALKDGHKDKTEAILAAEKAGDQELARRLIEEKTQMPTPLLSKMKPQ
ncbi:MAG: DNA primase [Deltaproteobacteria bacterium]|nr:DNA primase [Deltaproteobacteria bacterium]